MASRVTKFFKSKNLYKVVGVALVLLVLAFVWLTTGTLTKAKEKVLSVLPFPIATVNGKFVLASQYLFRLDTAKKIYESQKINFTETDKAKILTLLIEEEKVRQLAFKRNIRVTQGEIEAEIKALKANNEQDFSKLLSSYGLTENNFGQTVVKPEAYKSKLATWYNSQRSLNAESFKLAQDVQTKIAAGEKFEDLAKVYDQDANTKPLSGDLGYMEIYKILPELQGHLDSMGVGEVKLVSSRFGLHIFKLIDKDNRGEGGGIR